MNRYINYIVRHYKQKSFKRKEFTSNRKIIVIESDDWGTIRMPSSSVRSKMDKLDLDIKNNSYNRFDSIATVDDLSLLFEILSKYSDINGNCPVITANTCMANPDFDKIKNNGFTEYFYEPFTSTIEKYEGCSFELWREGMKNKIFRPQLHCREHLNVEKWLKELRNNNNELLLSFDFKTWGNRYNNFIDSTVVALEELSENSLSLHKNSIIEASNIFENIFGFRSKSFIAPCYTWNSNLNETLKNIGVDILQGSLVQKEYIYQPEDKVKYSKKYHYTGEFNDIGQVYMVRNCFFEPTQSIQLGIDTCLKGIERAFKKNTPAIISVHRINFIGAIDSSNRDRNLKLFDELLRLVVKRWPDVEFMSSDELGEYILNSSR